mmetsp:Transcript_102953/g.330249  ORF Transcript_102953/g.330249 Transcript_102953/m.330249 type:complete len:104 (-) Transcript_102953:186-497(-)
MSNSQLISTSGPPDREHRAHADHFTGETPIQIGNPVPAATMLLHASLHFSMEHTAARHVLWLAETGVPSRPSSFTSRDSSKSSWEQRVTSIGDLLLPPMEPKA